jgi:hypothetical protein
VSWLLPTLEEIPFPELFSARTFIGDQPPVRKSWRRAPVETCSDYPESRDRNAARL